MEVDSCSSNLCYATVNFFPQNTLLKCKCPLMSYKFRNYHVRNIFLAKFYPHSILAYTTE